MKRIRIMGLCLVALFAFSAVAVSSASASPAFMKCVKVKGAKFIKGCGSEGGKGGYEKQAVTADEAFKNKNGVSNLLVFIPGKGIVGDTKCDKAKGSGNVLPGGTEVETTVQFEKCESSEKTCTSVQAGEKKGDITTNPLSGTLNANSEAKSGVAITIGGKGGGNSAEFDCEGLEISTAGVVSGEQAGDVGKASKSSSNVFETNAEGEPTIATEGSRDTLLTTIVGVGTVPSGESTTAAIKGAELGVF